MDETRAQQVRAFMEAHTAPLAPPSCPEVRLYLAPSMDGLWAAGEKCLDLARMPPPFWGVAWVGGQALARYLFETPHMLVGKTVYDVGSGSGLCAIAAALAGAGRVIANDIDALSHVAIARNAELNSAGVEIEGTDRIGRDIPDADVILVGDLWYERQVADRVTPWLRTLAAAGKTVIIADRRRAYFPRSGVVGLAEYEIETLEETEGTALTTAGVWRLQAAP